MSRNEIIERVRELAAEGNVRRAIDNGCVRFMGVFSAPCRQILWIVLRIVDYPQKGKRRITYAAIGELPDEVDGWRHRAGKIEKVDWFGWHDGGLHCDVDARVIGRLKDRKHEQNQGLTK